MRRFDRRWWLLRMRNIGIIYLAYLAVLFVIQRRIIFPGWAVRHRNPGVAARTPGLVRLTLPIPEGQVEGWLLPGKGVTAEHPGPAVIFAHGNGELIEDWVEKFESYRDLGISVLVPEYRGYGDSQGDPSGAAIVSDYVRFYDLLVARPEVDRSRIVIQGRSIGGGIACGLAAKRKPAALILQSTFANLDGLAHRRLAPAFLLRDKFDNVGVVASLDVPVFIAHGKRDSVISYSNSLALAAAAKHPTFISYESNHNDCPPDWDEFVKSVAEFLAKAGVLKG